MLEYIKAGFGVGLGFILSVVMVLILLGAWDWLKETTRFIRTFRDLPQKKKK